MKLQIAVTFLAGLICATVAHAQTCSGGADGGMDAAGSQCSQPERVPIAEPASAATVAADARVVGALAGMHEAAAFRAVGLARATPKSARLVTTSPPTRNPASDRTVRQ